MTLFNYINQNLDRIKYEVANGIIPCSIIKHYQIYSRFDYYCKAGHNILQATYFTAIDFKASERTVYRIINKMESEV
jgi:hypothetical protein